MRYKCTKAFSVNKVDDNWGQTDELFHVEKGSVWLLDDSLLYPRVVDANGLSLENEEGQWLEIYPEDLKEFFKALEDENE